MKRVGVSITALPGAWFTTPLVFPPLCYCFWPFPLAYSTLICLPMWSAPLSSRALLKEDFFENLTKANPFGFPSGLEMSLTLRIFPHSLKSSLISESKALKERPWTATSNYPVSSSSLFSSFSSSIFYYCSTFFAGFFTSAEGFLLGAGFSYYSSSSDTCFFAGFLTSAEGFLFGAGFYYYSYSEDVSFFGTFFAGFFCTGFYYSDSYSDDYFFKAFFFWSTLTASFDTFLGLGCLGCYYYSSDEVYFFATFFGWTATFFGGSGSSSDEDSFFFNLVYFLSLVWTTAFLGGAMISSSD